MCERGGCESVCMGGESVWVIVGRRVCGRRGYMYVRRIWDTMSLSISLIRLPTRKLVVSTGIGGCPTPSEVKFDAIFIDIAGLRQFKSVVKGRLQHYQ